VGGRDIQDLLQAAVRPVPYQRAAAPQRHPDETVGVDGQAIGHDPVAADAGEHTAVADGAAGGVVVEDVNPARERVDVVHPRLIQAPADPVGDADTGQHRGQLRAHDAAPVPAASSPCPMTGSLLDMA